MKALKVWGWLLFISAVVLFGIGLFGGEFNKYGLYGTSPQAMLLTIFSAVCLLLSATVLVIVISIKKK